MLAPTMATAEVVSTLGRSVATKYARSAAQRNAMGSPIPRQKR